MPAKSKLSACVPTLQGAFEQLSDLAAEHRAIASASVGTHPRLPGQARASITRIMNDCWFLGGIKRNESKLNKFLERMDYWDILRHEELLHISEE
jgi:hypothetical protein